MKFNIEYEKEDDGRLVAEIPFIPGALAYGNLKEEAASKVISLTFNDYIKDYKKQIEKGDIKIAYKGLMEYIMDLRLYFKNKYPDYFVSGSIYQGFMDMTYFAFFPESLKDKKLKIAIVFNHDTFRFEVWLAGYNKQIQTKYWKLFKESNWNKYRLLSSTIGADSIIEHTLVDNPDFNDLDTITHQIESGTLKFIEDVMEFVSKNSN